MIWLWSQSLHVKGTPNTRCCIVNNEWSYKKRCGLWTLFQDDLCSHEGLLSPCWGQSVMCVRTWAKAQGRRWTSILLWQQTSIQTDTWGPEVSRSWQRKRAGRSPEVRRQGYWGRAHDISLCVSLGSGWNVWSFALLKECISTTEVHRWFVMNPELLQSLS